MLMMMSLSSLSYQPLIHVVICISMWKSRNQDKKNSFAIFVVVNAANVYSFLTITDLKELSFSLTEKHSC